MPADSVVGLIVMAGQTIKVNGAVAATGGVNFYPFPQKVPSASLRFAYSALFKETGEFANNRVALQVQVAF